MMTLSGMNSSSSTAPPSTGMVCSIAETIMPAALMFSASACNRLKVTSFIAKKRSPPAYLPFALPLAVMIS